MVSARHNRKRKHGRRRMGLLFKLLCGAALAAALTVGATVFFQVETIAVVGSSRYTPEEVIAASGVAVGDNLFRMNKNQVSQRIRQQLPYIGDVAVQRGLPSTLTFTVKEWAAAARVEVYADPETAEPPDGEQEGDKSSEEAPEAPEEQGTAATAPWLINAAGKLLEEAGEGSGGHPGDRADRPLPPGGGADGRVPEPAGAAGDPEKASVRPGAGGDAGAGGLHRPDPQHLDLHGVPGAVRGADPPG